MWISKRFEIRSGRGFDKLVPEDFLMTDLWETAKLLVRHGLPVEFHTIDGTVVRRFSHAGNNILFKMSWLNLEGYVEVSSQKVSYERAINTIHMLLDIYRTEIYCKDE